jgi:ABC-type antimicrobial peptide transport system permease subunit
VLAPERASVFVVSGFAVVALLVAVVGVSGVLAFSVSARTREFGVRLAIGSTPRRLLLNVLSDGVRIVAAGILLGTIGGALCAVTVRRALDLDLPGLLPTVAAASLLAAAAIVASLVPATRAFRVDVLRALRSE